MSNIAYCSPDRKMSPTLKVENNILLLQHVCLVVGFSQDWTSVIHITFHGNSVFFERGNIILISVNIDRGHQIYLIFVHNIKILIWKNTSLVVVH